MTCAILLQISLLCGGPSANNGGFENEKEGHTRMVRKIIGIDREVMIIRMDVPC